jgi:hypothetical protein
MLQALMAVELQIMEPRDKRLADVSQPVPTYAQGFSSLEVKVDLNELIRRGFSWILRDLTFLRCSRSEVSLWRIFEARAECVMFQAEGSGAEGRARRWRSVAEKRRIVQLTLEPGASVALVAGAHHGHGPVTWRKSGPEPGASLRWQA